MDSLDNSTHYLILYNSFQKTEGEGTLLNSLCEAGSAMRPKPDR